MCSGKFADVIVETQREENGSLLWPSLQVLLPKAMKMLQVSAVWWLFVLSYSLVFMGAERAQTLRMREATWCSKLRPGQLQRETWLINGGSSPGPL